MPSAADILPAPSATAPAKRGRKPGPLSRSAREAQRRLNHSIIEKARRTKINDALATLRQLVPVDYGYHPQSDEDDDEDDDEEPEGTRQVKAKQKPKGTSKREEKEKEFKLEILVRTVSFLQDLLKRVDTMENALSTCQHCGANQSSKKRKHSQLHDDNENDRTSKQSKVVRSAEEHPRQVATNPTPKPHNGPILNPHSSPVSNSHSSPVASPSSGGSRLPSISSWLPDVPIDPALLSPKSQPNQSPHAFPYLPSPPASTLFTPTRTSQVPPVLNLGPVATAAMVTLPPLPPPHTSEDESAASLLLQIAISPPFRPSTTTISNYNLPDPSKFSLHSDVRNQRVSGHTRQPETPRSLLGLHQEREY